MEKKDYEINLMFIIRSLLHHWYVILLAVAILAAGAFSFAKFFVKPQYSSTIRLYVSNDTSTTKDYVSSSELTVARELTDTYITILTTADTLDAIIEKGELDYSASQLGKMISAGPVNDTEIFYVTVTASDPIEAVNIAKTIADVLPERISHIVEKSSVKIVQKAQTAVRISPNVSMYTLVGAMLGLIASCAVIIIRELADNSVQDEEYASNTYNIRTLAYIPNIYEQVSKKKQETAENRKKRQRGKLPNSEERTILCENLPFGAAEAYKMLRANLQNISGADSSYGVIGITSPEPSVGKSTLAINYAYSLAQTGKKVLLIEADMRKPVIAKRLLLSTRLGLSDMLMDDTANHIQDSGRMDNWKVICAGTPIDNPAELLSSRSMDLLIEKFRHEFDYVIVDLPPVNEVSDAITVSRCLDGMICAIKQGETTKMNLETAMHYMAFLKTELVGFVITSANIGGKYGKYGNYGKYGKYQYYSYEQ